MTFIYLVILLSPHLEVVKTEVQSMTCWGCTISKWQS